jgi:hypothetical protein
VTGASAVVVGGDVVAGGLVPMEALVVVVPIVAVPIVVVVDAAFAFAFDDDPLPQPTMTSEAIAMEATNHDPLRGVMACPSTRLRPSLKP